MREGEGTWLGHVLEHVAIELQNIAGEEVTFGKTRSAGAPGVYTVSTNTRSAMRALPQANWARLRAAARSLRPEGSVPEG
jgi:cyanophycin synthetase